MAKYYAHFRCPAESMEELDEICRVLSRMSAVEMRAKTIADGKTRMTDEDIEKIRKKEEEAGGRVERRG